MMFKPLLSAGSLIQQRSVKFISTSSCFVSVNSMVLQIISTIFSKKEMISSFFLISFELYRSTSANAQSYDSHIVLKIKKWYWMLCRNTTVTLQSKSLLLSGPMAGNKDEQRHIEVTDPLLHIYKPQMPIKCQQHNGIWINEHTSEREFLLHNF